MKNIWLAAADGDLNTVTAHIQQGVSPNAYDDNTYTPMHAAASYAHLHILDFLIAHGGDVNITDDDGDTPLYTVEDIPTARYLFDHGANLTHSNMEGISPIDHLREDFPNVADYLQSLITLANPTPAAAVAPVSPSQHAQNTVSESLTDTLMQRIQRLADDTSGDTEMDEDQLRQIVTSTVLQGMAQGIQLHHDTHDLPADENAEKKSRKD